MMRLIEDKGIIDVDDDDDNGEDDDDDSDQDLLAILRMMTISSMVSIITDGFLEDHYDDNECIKIGQKLCREIKEARISNVTLCLIIDLCQILKFSAHRCGHANNAPLVER